MSSPFVGEIRMFGGNFAPNGWAYCSGQVMAIAQNDVLFALIGTTYGGDGQTTFSLPDLQGRLPVHQGSNPFGSYVIGQQAGVESVTLTTNQTGGHSHGIPSNSAPGTTSNPSGAVVAGAASNPYTTSTRDMTFGAQMVGLAGGSQPHDNMMPFLAVHFIISLFGIFPSRN